MQIDAERRITRFVEKPKEAAVLDSLEAAQRTGTPNWELKATRNCSWPPWAFIFSTAKSCVELLNNTLTDFGKHIIPGAINTHRVFSYVYQGYWEDIGTIRSFFEANLDVTSELPRFNFFDMSAPVFSRPRFLPGSKINGAQIDHAVVSDGCIINHAQITSSIVGVRSLVGAGSELKRVILLGCDYYESLESIQESMRWAGPRIGIGDNTRIENAIIDKNARIGDNVVISPAGKPDHVDHPLYYIRDGIVIIPKNGIIPHGTVI